MIRTFGVQTLTGAAQPWMGDVTTAAFAPTNSGQYEQVTVASTKFYQVGDRIVLGAGSTSPLPNILRVNKIASATVLDCISESAAQLSAFATNAIIALSIAAWAVDFQNIGVDPVWLGTDNTVTAVPGGSVFRQLLPTSTNYFNSLYRYVKHTGQNPVNTAEGWMIGTAAQTMLVAALVN